MKRYLIVLFLLFVAVINCGAFGKPKKEKCKKPIYFFENVKKEVLFEKLDNAAQAAKYDVGKYYPELGFMAINYKVKKEVIPVNILLKQYSNDVYLFIDIEKNNTDLEKYIYNSLKDDVKNSYLMNDDLFCKDLTKDASQISTRRKPYLQEKPYNPNIYVIDMKRYVGYDKKVYKWEVFKDKLKKKTEGKKKL